MLKPSRFEKNSSICYISALSFVFVMFICLLCNYVDAKAFVYDATTGQNVDYSQVYSGFGLLTVKALKDTHVSVAGYLNLLTVIMMCVMVLSVVYGVLSSRQEAWTKSLILLQVCFIFCIIFTILSPFQLRMEITEYYITEWASTPKADVSFGFMPWVGAVAAIAGFVVFRIFVKKGKYKV
ncbi:MAG: hypothetical protein J6V68_00175 [Clostridia bacterium]|nr:hypothetical protein [Clostridia bacterium]